MSPQNDDLVSRTEVRVLDEEGGGDRPGDDGTFEFGPGAGEATIGGAGQEFDTVRLNGVGWPSRGDWTIYFTRGGVRFDGVSEWPQDGVTAIIARPQWILVPGSCGVIQLKDGSRLAFFGLERIIWGEGSIISTTGGPAPLPDRVPLAAE